MPDKPLGLRERNRIRTRDEILVAMSLMLGEQSFESITVDEVAQRAGVSRGTIYSYFPDGREQLIRDAYLRIANQVIEKGSAQRDAQTDVSKRVLAIAGALASVTGTPEGRFYGLLGATTFGPLGGVTGSASGMFHTMLTEDLQRAMELGLITATARVEELAVLVSGAIREIGARVASEPAQAEALLDALRVTCEALLAPTKK
ncbi:MAG: TetR/AcrR family transcriptional regulator [Actinobacteria bacterium]|nr:TetR/AcrR family transcriptional regulator [Actinomycetota bacterium]